VSEIKYRHVLLVKECSDSHVFEGIEMHAGGIAWYKDCIYVADTHNGLRVFNVNHIMRVQLDPDKVGIHGGSAYAYDYSFILPQMGLYKLKTPGVPRFSFVSLVPDSTPYLLSGEFAEFGATPNLYKWALGETGLLDIAQAQPTGTLGCDGVQIQGAVEALGYLWLSHSYWHTAWFTRQAGVNVKNSYGWPLGAEDLYFDKTTRELWCVTEWEEELEFGPRMVFSVDLEQYT
jgi:hypothetical protein